MGKIINILAAGSVIALAACTEQNVESPVNFITVDAELATSAPQTKTTMTEFNELWWSPKDKISVFYKSGDAYRHSEFSSGSKDASAETVFSGSFTIPEGTSVSDVEGVAVYPVSAEGNYSDGKLTVTVPDVQNAVEGTFQEGAYPVVAKMDDVSQPLTFKGVCGGVKFAFQTAGITSFTFKANNGVAVAGTAAVTFDADGNPVTEPLEGKSEITVNAPAGGFDPGKWYYMTALPAVMENGCTLTASDGTVLVALKKTLSIKQSVFGVLDSKDAPDTYGDLKSHLKPVSWWDEEKYLRSEPAQAPATATGDRINAWYVKGMKNVRFASDANYLYGYMEVDMNQNSGDWADLETTHILDSLVIWIDADGVGEGQGGGWYFSSRMGYEMALVGASADAYSPKEWEPRLTEQTANNGAMYGARLSTPSAPGYGNGEFDAATKIFKYSYILDRRVLGIRNTTSVNIGITLFKKWNDALVNPDNGGYAVPLNNMDKPLVDETELKRSVKDFDSWTSVAEAEKSESDWMDKGKSVVKFTSDRKFVYGYFEVNTDDMVYPGVGYTIFNPAMLANLAVGIDVDGISDGQGPGDMFSYKGYEVLLRGGVSSSTITDAKGWSLAAPIVSSIKNDTKYDGFGDDLPDYTISTSRWDPEIYDMSTNEGSWGSKVLAGLANFASGKGKWNPDTKVFQYSFILDRSKLGISDRTQLNIGVAFEYQYNGYVCIPGRKGFTIALNN